uniref:Guanine nucleotide-binding protein subunit gamma n=1 Tax=Loligo forbesii TaxID=6618 RepID=GBG_LOLFO|nr:RecName: Full=Guanine nucleotide-binding protein subunit gamma; Flags: Precursor [Loligo forbesii]CAA78816.1 G-protein gamma subunit [Loligo forbesii]prf//1902232A G protein:SUBUNIT=gamma [Loligo forbesii]
MNKMQGKKKKKEEEEEEERIIPPELWKLIIEQYKRQLAKTDVMKVSETVKLHEEKIKEKVPTDHIIHAQKPNAWVEETKKSGGCLLV